MTRQSTIRGLGFVALGLAFAALALWAPGSRKTSVVSASSSIKPANVPVFIGHPTAAEESSVRVISITQPPETGTLDMDQLGVRPLPAPLPLRGDDPTTDNSTIGKGQGFMGITPEIVNQSTTSAFVTLVANFAPAETVNFALNGGVATPFVADSAGKLRINVNTGAGFGFITVECVGLTSGRRAGGVVQVAPTGPYLVGTAAGQHSVNPTGGTNVVSLYGRGFTPASTVTMYRNGVSLGTSVANAGGRLIVDVTVAATADTSAIYTADSALAGSMTGQTVEERADAGAPPIGDQNIARVLSDRPVMNSVSGGTMAVVAEGFQAGENINVTGAVVATIPADANGASGFFVTIPAATPGVFAITCTGATSGRVARGTALSHANVTNIRSMIMAPHVAAPGGLVTAMGTRLTAGDPGNFFLDGVLIGPNAVNGLGYVAHAFTKPSTGFVHSVGWNGTTEAMATTLLIVGTPTAAPGTVSGRITNPGGVPVGGATIGLSGGSSRTTITDSDGNYHFENLDTGSFYTVTPGLANYSFSPANRSFSLVSNQTDAGFTATADASQSANAIDSAEYFVRQQYLDFLGREPDQGGFDYWTGQFNQCAGDAACISQKRIDVSAAFFMSGEFQATGSYVYDMYAGLLGRTPGYNEFTPDRAQVVGGSGLDAAKTAFAQGFVQRSEFTNRYPAGLTREEFVDAVLQTMQERSGVDLSSQRAGLLTDYDNGGRPIVARHAAELAPFVSAEYNRAFVLMEYFGYLRRGEDTNGYAFWLNVLNQGSGNNYRGMVCSFLTSTEYQNRFSSIVTHNNGECGQ